MTQNRLLIFEDYSKILGELRPNTLYVVSSLVGSICLVINNGTFFFFKNECPHLGVPFSQSGGCNAYGEIVCKEHGHRYSLLTGCESDGRKECLMKYNFEIVNNQLFLFY